MSLKLKKKKEILFIVYVARIDLRNNWCPNRGSCILSVRSEFANSCLDYMGVTNRDLAIDLNSIS
jgi:hypothetical protein